MKKLDITNYKIINKKIDKNIKLLFLSDLHNRNIVDEIVDSINKINPDIIIMGGDMVNQDLNDMDNYLELCKRLNDREVYYTFGNHEEMLDITDRHKYLKSLLIKIGVNPATAEEDACKIEHDLSDETYEKLKAAFPNN